MRFKLVWMSLCFFALACSSQKMASTPAAPAPAPAASTPTPAPVATKDSPAADTVTCQRGSEERLMSIEMIQPKGCKLWYTKDGGKTNPASSTKGPNHCETVRDRIRGKLETANFKCSGGTSTAAVKSPAAPEKTKKAQAEAPKAAAPAATPAKKAEPAKSSAEAPKSDKKI